MQKRTGNAKNLNDVKSWNSVTITQFELAKVIYTSGFLQKCNLTATAKLVLMALIQHYNANNADMFPSQKFLARQLGISEKSVERAIANLRDEEYIYYVTQKVNRYRFTAYFFEQVKMSVTDRQNVGSAHRQNVGETNKEEKRNEKEVFLNFSFRGEKAGHQEQRNGADAPLKSVTDKGYVNGERNNKNVLIQNFCSSAENSENSRSSSSGSITENGSAAKSNKSGKDSQGCRFCENDKRGKSNQNNSFENAENTSNYGKIGQSSKNKKSGRKNRDYIERHANTGESGSSRSKYESEKGTWPMDWSREDALLWVRELSPVFKTRGIAKALTEKFGYTHEEIWGADESEYRAFCEAQTEAQSENAENFPEALNSTNFEEKEKVS